MINPYDYQTAQEEDYYATEDYHSELWRAEMLSMQRDGEAELAYDELETGESDPEPLTFE